MRQYRGKRKDNGEWVYGWYAYFPSSDSHTITVDYYDTPSQLTEQYYVVGETVGQSTGLCDKNGKEIYESDKLKFDYAKKLGAGTVVYQEYSGEFGIKVDTPKGERIYRMRSNYDCWDNNILENHEIIGTIHDEEQP